MSTLEDRFPAFVDDGRPVDGVVVLGGAENPYLSAARGQPSFSDAAERIFALGDLARRYPQAKLVFTGANNSLFETPGQTESDTIRAVLPSLGLAADRVLFEDRARNTAENARNVMDMVRPKLGERWLVVTSAAHMPRSMGCFRAIGFEVDGLSGGLPHRDRRHAVAPLSDGRGRPDRSRRRGTRMARARRLSDHRPDLDAVPGALDPASLVGKPERGRRRGNPPDRPACPCDR